MERFFFCFFLSFFCCDSWYCCRCVESISVCGRRIFLVLFAFDLALKLTWWFIDEVEEKVFASQIRMLKNYVIIAHMNDLNFAPRRMRSYAFVLCCVDPLNKNGTDKDDYWALRVNILKFGFNWFFFQYCIVTH